MVEKDEKKEKERRKNHERDWEIGEAWLGK